MNEEFYDLCLNTGQSGMGEVLDLIFERHPEISAFEFVLCLRKVFNIPPHELKIASTFIEGPDVFSRAQVIEHLQPYLESLDEQVLDEIRELGEHNVDGVRNVIKSEFPDADRTLVLDYYQVAFQCLRNEARVLFRSQR